MPSSTSAPSTRDHLFELEEAAATREHARVLTEMIEGAIDGMRGAHVLAKALLERQELREQLDAPASADLERLQSIEAALYGAITGETYLVDAKTESLAMYNAAVDAVADIAQRFHDA
jgi:hypothetical protein